MNLERSLQKRSPKSLQGFGRLFAKEMKSWWGTRRWLVQGLVWTLGLNGLLFVALFVLPPLMAAQGEPLGDLLEIGGQMYFALGTMAVAVGVVVLTQGSVIDERESGTAAWILSKPVSRSAFVLSKVAANSISILVLMVLIPALLALLQLSLASEGQVQWPAFALAVLLMALHTLFYLTLTILLGVRFENRGTILGVALALLLGGMLLRNLPVVALVMPWLLPDIAGVVMTEPQQLLLLPVVMTGLWTLAFISTALLTFNRIEL
jgi:ABC-2 type transport system permease protein